MSPEYSAGFQLTEQELQLESGLGANREEVELFADSISENWGTPDSSLPQPTVLLLGGFQGSGKTTVGDRLAQDLGLLTVSPDEIRSKLFTANYPFSVEFLLLVNAIKFELINRAIELRSSFIVDQALTPDRVTLVKNILQEHPEYRLLSIFLTAPKEVLRKRVEERAGLPGKYKGTVDELEASMTRYEQRYGNPENGGYDVIIDTNKEDAEGVLESIRQKLIVR